MKKLVLGTISICLIFFSSCSSEDESEGGQGAETPIVELDPTNITKETLEGVWEVVSLIDEDDSNRIVKKGEEFDYFEADNCSEKPYSRDALIDEKYAFIGEEYYSKFEFSEQVYIYDDTEMNDEGGFVSCDVSGKKLGEKEIEKGFYIQEVVQIIVENSTIYYQLKTSEIDNGITFTHYSSYKIEIGDETTLAYAEESNETDTDITLLSYIKSATIKKISNTVDLANFNNGIAAEFINDVKIEEKQFLGSGSGVGVISFTNTCKYNFISQTNSLAIVLTYKGGQVTEGTYTLHIATDINEKIEGDDSCTPRLFNETLWGDIVVDGNKISFVQVIGESIGLNNVVYEFEGSIDANSISGTIKHVSPALEETIVYPITL